jgi:outer membrane protein assembly factor BamB
MTLIAENASGLNDYAPVRRRRRQWRAVAPWALCAVCLLLVANQIQASGPASDLKFFRSDGGVATGPGALPDRLDAPEQLNWRVSLDSGHSTPILTAGRIFLTTYRPESKELAIVALDETSGRLLWRKAINPERIEQTHQIGNPATATPACDGQRLFVFFGSAGLFCYDLEGRKLWEQAMGPFRDEYGAGSSPILFEDKVILNQDHDRDSFLAAFDRVTGRPLWKIERPDAVRSYSTPVVWTGQGKPQLLVAGALRLTAYDPAKGETLWWADGLARIVIPTPVVSGPMIYMASWSPGGDAGKRLELPPWPAALAKWDANHDGKLSRDEIDDREVLDRFFRMDLDQDGLLDQKEWERHAEVFRRAQNAILALKPAGHGEQGAGTQVWKYSRGIPYVATPVLANGILWMVKEGGIVTKLAADSGTLLQEERVPGFGNYFASPVAGDGKVYFTSEAGTVSVLGAEREWRLISSRDFHEKIYATPVLDHGHMFLRTDRALYCFHGREVGP